MARSIKPKTGPNFPIDTVLNAARRGARSSPTRGERFGWCSDLA
jgi:hypothetical protein